MVIGTRCHFQVSFPVWFSHPCLTSAFLDENQLLAVVGSSPCRSDYSHLCPQKKKFPWHDRGLPCKTYKWRRNLYFYWMTQSQLLISRKAPSTENPDQDLIDRDFDALHASNPVDFTFKLHSWMSGRAPGSKCCPFVHQETILLFCLLGLSEHPAGSFCPAFCINSCLLVMCCSVRESL